MEKELALKLLKYFPKVALKLEEKVSIDVQVGFPQVNGDLKFVGEWGFSITCGNGDLPLNSYPLDEMVHVKLLFLLEQFRCIPRSYRSNLHYNFMCFLFELEHYLGGVVTAFEDLCLVYFENGTRCDLVLDRLHRSYGFEKEFFFMVPNHFEEPFSLSQIKQYMQALKSFANHKDCFKTNFRFNSLFESLLAFMPGLVKVATVTAKPLALSYHELSASNRFFFYDVFDEVVKAIQTVIPDYTSTRSCVSSEFAKRQLSFEPLVFDLRFKMFANNVEFFKQLFDQIDLDSENLFERRCLKIKLIGKRLFEEFAFMFKGLLNSEININSYNLIVDNIFKIN